MFNHIFLCCFFVLIAVFSCSLFRGFSESDLGDIFGYFAGLLIGSILIPYRPSETKV